MIRSALGKVHVPFEFPPLFPWALLFKWSFLTLILSMDN